MKTKITLLMTLISAVVFSQSKELLVETNSNSASSNKLSYIEKIIFPEDSITLIFTDGSQIGYALVEVMNMSFENSVSTQMTKGKSLKEVQIYPNPFEDVLNVKLTNSFSDKALVQIIDLNGRTVLKELFSGPYLQNLELNTSRLKKGTYILCVSTLNDKQTHIILKR